MRGESMALRQSDDFLAVRMTVRGAEFDHYVLTFDEACFIQALAKTADHMLGLFAECGDIRSPALPTAAPLPRAAKLPPRRRAA